MSSGRGRWGNRVIGVLMLVLAGALIAGAVNAYFVTPKAVMHLAGDRYEVHILDDEQSRIRGLSGTDNLPADEAMLFVFDSDARWSIWMKDMKYSIDIVWLDSSRRVVDFVTDAAPDSYPNKTFMPKEPARYVVEFASGTVKEKGIEVGQEAVFSGTDRQL